MMIYRKNLWLFLFLAALIAFIPVAQAANLDFNLETSEDVTVDTSGGVPRLSLMIGATQRYADYVAGGSTATNLLFRYAIQAGDFDADGITVQSPVDLNGGSITDLNGNPLTLTYTPPATDAILVQTYTVSFLTTPVTMANQSSISIQIAKAPIGATYNYTISSDGGAGTVTGTGTIASAPQTISGIDVSTLADGTLTVSLTITDGSGTGEARTATTTKSSTRVLDSLPTPIAAYGLRHLRSAYTGHAIRVRRNSDNSEENIGFTANGSLDTTALSNFCGVSSCFIRTWYDQSGNGYNATQTTTANQPLLVNAGSLVQLSTRPSIQWNTGSHALTVTGLSWNAYTISSVIRHDDVSGAVRALLTKRTNTSTSQFFWFTFNSNGGNITWDQNGSGTGSRFNTGFLPATNTNYIYTLVRPLTGTNRTQYVNGVAQGTTATNTNVINSDALTIGNDPSTTGRGAGFRMGELIIFGSALSTTNRQTLEADQATHYNIP
jgi:hypothetical protein